VFFSYSGDFFFLQEQQHKFDNEHKDRLAHELASAHEKMRNLTAEIDTLNNANKQLTLEVSFDTVIGLF